MGATYNQDVIAWSIEQAGLLRAGEFSAIDATNIADEIEAVGKAEQRHFETRLGDLLLSLLKWKYQPSRRCAAWRRIIEAWKRQVFYELKCAPSLMALSGDGEWLSMVWNTAVAMAMSETGLDSFPETCPWSLDEIVRGHLDPV